MGEEAAYLIWSRICEIRTCKLKSFIGRRLDRQDVIVFQQPSVGVGLSMRQSAIMSGKCSFPHQTIRLVVVETHVISRDLHHDRSLHLI